MADVKMVVVNGVRYRPEHAPSTPSSAPDEKQAEQPSNKSQKPRDKSV